MAVKQFRATKFKPESLDTIKKMQDVVKRYAAIGMRMTARQLYYVFVTSNWIINDDKYYKKMTKLLADARYAGMIDWAAIEDRGRVVTIWQDFDNVVDCVDEATRTYRLKRWDDQPNYVELWVEKQALAGVLEPMASEFHISLMVNKGYSSASAMYDASNRFKAKRDKDRVLLYLGDHDPSGEDMVRDIRDRLYEFGAAVDVRKVALTMAQIEEYNPPPNPAKKSDIRYDKYAAKHGDSSWEVDALPPDVLQTLIRTELDELLDHEAWDAVLEREESDKAKLRKAAERIARS